MIRVGLDTNILLYAVDSLGEPEKNARALDLVDWIGGSGRGMLPLQALGEFYAVAVRKKRAPADLAAVYVDRWASVFPVHEAVFADVRDAIRVQRHHGLAFWDAMIWSVVRRAGAQVLFSEDLQDGRELEGVRFVNPFNPANDAEIAALFP
eukprot:TRINITY_DN57171_c0_g1_i1.p1 TRINITY_DN57171_c0_g1~~TRINITY_DN57171_c0_g1_i1.p1  ORF type:complete len:151 (-),score=18.74 TRINITY_DN57171_c0_g1_i1:75-527(-)